MLSDCKILFRRQVVYLVNQAYFFHSIDRAVNVIHLIGR